MNISHSELLHAGECLGVGHTLDDLVPILDVFVKVLHPRVEDITETVLPQVLHRDNPQCSRK